MKKSSKSWLIIKVEPSRFLWGVRPWIKVLLDTTNASQVKSQHRVLQSFSLSLLVRERDRAFKGKGPVIMLLEVFPTKMERWSAKNSLIIWASFNNRGKLQGVPIIQLSFPISVVGWTENIIVLLLGRYLLMCIPIIKWPSRCVLLFSQTTYILRTGPGSMPVTKQQLDPPSGQCKLIVIVKKYPGVDFVKGLHWSSTYLHTGLYFHNGIYYTIFVYRDDRPRFQKLGFWKRVLFLYLIGCQNIFPGLMISPTESKAELRNIILNLVKKRKENPYSNPNLAIISL